MYTPLGEEVNVLRTEAGSASWTPRRRPFLRFALAHCALQTGPVAIRLRALLTSLRSPLFSEGYPVCDNGAGVLVRRSVFPTEDLITGAADGEEVVEVTRCEGAVGSDSWDRVRHGDEDTKEGDNLETEDNSVEERGLRTTNHQHGQSRT